LCVFVCACVCKYVFLCVGMRWCALVCVVLCWSVLVYVGLCNRMCVCACVSVCLCVFCMRVFVCVSSCECVSQREILSACKCACACTRVCVCVCVSCMCVGVSVGVYVDVWDTSIRVNILQRAQCIHGYKHTMTIFSLKVYLLSDNVFCEVASPSRGSNSGIVRTRLRSLHLETLFLTCILVESVSYRIFCCGNETIRR